MDTHLRACLRILHDNGTLSSTQVKQCIEEIMAGKASPSQIGAFLYGLNASKLNAETLHAGSQALLHFAVAFNGGSDATFDVVGTGGDMQDSFNASTASSFVISAAGVKVAKHGNRSSSGRSGSADLIEALGINLHATPDRVQHIYNECGFAFLFSQQFHPAMKAVASIRKEIGVRTIFNLLGPLSNPAQPHYMLVGVGKEEYGPLYAEVLRLKKLRRALVVHSLDGLDEISPCAKTKAWLITHDHVTEMLLDPLVDFGMTETHSLKSISGGNASENAETFIRMLQGKEKGPVLDFVLLNAAAGLWVSEKAATFHEGMKLARHLIKSGQTYQLLQKYLASTKHP